MPQRAWSSQVQHDADVLHSKHPVASGQVFNAQPGVVQIGGLPARSGRRPHDLVRLSGIIGNRAVQRLLDGPVVQRSWDEFVDTASDWFSDSSTSDAPMSVEDVAVSPLEHTGEPLFEEALQPPEHSPQEIDSAMEDEGLSEDWFQPSSEPDFQPAIEQAADSPPADAESWIDGLLEVFQPTEDTALGSIVKDEEAEPDEERIPPECAALDNEVRRLIEEMRQLYDLSVALLPALLEAKQRYESLAAAYGQTDPRAIEASQHYDGLQREYDAVVDRFIETKRLRDARQIELDACKRAYQSKKKPGGGDGEIGV